MAKGIEKILLEKSKQVNKEINTLVAKYVFQNLRNPALHLIRAGGKRIRPSITLLTAEAFNVNPNFALPPACSIELMHTASLVHDDIIDNCTIRRGVKSVHMRWDIPTAVLAGDALLSVAVRALVIPLARANIGKISLSYVSDDFIENLDLFSKFWGEICEGKKMDVLADFRTLTEKDVFTLIYKKTACLFELAGRLGANYAGAGPSESASLGKYGMNVGMAFQIQDDILGLIGDESVLGKNVGVDITNGKKTLMLCHFLRNCSAKEKKIVFSALGNRDIAREDLDEAIDLISEGGSIQYARKVSKIYVKNAKKHLKVLDSSPSRKILMQLPDFVIGRMK